MTGATHRFLPARLGMLLTGPQAPRSLDTSRILYASRPSKISGIPDSRRRLNRLLRTLDSRQVARTEQ